MPTSRADLEPLVSHLPAALATKRVDAALSDAAAFAEVLRLVPVEGSRRAALRKVFPDRAGVGNLLTRLKRFEEEGAVGLLNTWVPPAPKKVLTPEAEDAIRLLVKLDPQISAKELQAELAKLDCRASQTVIKRFRVAQGISRGPGGRSRQRQGAATSPARAKATTAAEPVPLAGSFFLLAAEAELGAVKALSEDLGKYLADLPEPLDDPIDDRAHRDDRGRFLSDYNEASERASPEVGAKFEGAARRRGEKDLREMRVAKSTPKARYRKDLALTLLPVCVETARWSSLQHWQGAHLGDLVGIAYQPATLDKHARELKLAAAGGAARDGVASFWMEREPRQDGAAIVYVDGSTKPLWTRTYTRSTKVSSTGRVMPATTTLMLNSGAGTPLVFREYSGGASLSQEVTGLLREVDEATGGGQVRRVVVLDREGHAVALYKELASKRWDFITPLRNQVTGPKARFEQVGAWLPYHETGDEVCDGFLWLRDSRPGEEDLRVRVVGRRRRHTGKFFWLATLTQAEDFDASAIVDLYFARWPLQELVFRDGKGRVGLDVHHGYGKDKVTNYAVIDEMERLDADAMKTHVACNRAERRVQGLGGDLVTTEDMKVITEEDLDAAKDAARGLGDAATPAEVRAAYEHVEDLRGQQVEYAKECAKLVRALNEEEQSLAALQERKKHLADRIETLERRREIYTVDTELDEIMTAYKLTFLNLATWVMRAYFGTSMQLDTLIRAILTLPGERVLTPTEETVRIYHQPRDPGSMKLVERACTRVNELALRRGKRILRMEVVKR